MFAEALPIKRDCILSFVRTDDNLRSISIVSSFYSLNPISKSIYPEKCMLDSVDIDKKEYLMFPFRSESFISRQSTLKERFVAAEIVAVWRDRDVGHSHSWTDVDVKDNKKTKRRKTEPGTARHNRGCWTETDEPEHIPHSNGNMASYLSTLSRVALPVRNVRYTRLVLHQKASGYKS